MCALINRTSLIEVSEPSVSDSVKILERSLPRELIKQVSFVFLFTYLLFSHASVLGQTEHQKDSLLAVYNDINKSDSVRFQAYYWYAKSFKNSNPDTTLQLANRLIDKAKEMQNEIWSKQFIAKSFYLKGLVYLKMGRGQEAKEAYFSALDYLSKFNYKELEVVINDNVGHLLAEQGNYDEAASFYKNSLDYYLKIDNKTKIADSYVGLGLVYFNQSNYPKTLEMAQKALKIFEELGNKRGLAQSFNNIGAIHHLSKEYDKALPAYQSALELELELKNMRGAAFCYGNIALVYEERDNNYTKALETYFKSLKISNEIDNKFLIILNHANIGNLYSKTNKYKEALNYYLIGLKKSIKHGYKSQEGSLLTDIGKVKVKQNLFYEGVKNCLKGLEIEKEIGALKDQRQACDCLKYAYQGLGNYQKAYEFNEKYYELKDSVFNEEKTKELTRLEMNYAFEQEQDSLAAVQRELDLKNQAQLQKAEATRNYSIGGFGAAAVLALLMYSRFSMSRKKNRIIQSEKDRSEELLLNILPLETAQELKEKGVVQAKHHDEVTVLFADITNFTQLSERIPPQELVATIHTYFSAFDQIMEKHGIEKIKTIGDAYMAASGLQNKPEQAKRMVQAAQEMLQYVRENPLSDDINFRVGIHTGPVVSGVVGVKKFAYDIWGDTVNTAARMESASEPGKINISEVTQQKIKDYFEHTSRGKVAIKGKGEMEMFFINSNTAEA